MNILFCAAELTPLIKVGGLADVAAALPRALRALGHDVRIVLPRYQRIREGSALATGPLTGGFLPVGERQEEFRIWQTTLEETPVYLIDIPAAFERPAIYGDSDDDRRFILFARGVISLMAHLRATERWEVNLVHANDWHTGLIPNYLKTYFAYTFSNVATLYTIHNLAYQGSFNPFTLYLSGLGEGGFVEERAGEAFAGQFNFIARGLIYTDLINTVSPTYAQEILTSTYGERLDGLLRARHNDFSGILNGIDYTRFNPATDPHIPWTYNADDPSGKAMCKASLQRECGFAVDAMRPLFGMVTRLAEQKGLTLLDQAMPWFLSQTNAQLVMLGTGEPAIEQAFTSYAQQYPERVSVQLRFDDPLSRRIYAGCDAFLMPSRFEPCGLGQMIALRYGTVPVVRATGGLSDTIQEGYNGNGFRFHPYETSELIAAVTRSIQAFHDPAGWATLRAHGMRQDLSWGASARAYVTQYERVARELRPRP